MSDLSESPQIGMTDVDADALKEPGVALSVLVDELGARLDGASAADAPTQGWRLLKQNAGGPFLLGSPVDSAGTSWRVAYVQGDADGALVTIHPDTAPLRASRAERARGLELRWPAMMTEGAGTGEYVIDIVNTGTERWLPSGDGFLVVGVLTESGDSAYQFGWADSGQHRAVPLDPGEYARVPVSMQNAKWAALQPGRYELQAVLVGLGLRAHSPLVVDLSAEMIARHLERASTRTATPEQRRRSFDTRIAQMSAWLTAGTHVKALTGAVNASTSDEDAIARIRVALDVDEATAHSIYHAPLRELMPSNAPALVRQIAEHTRQRDSAT